jgi:hypothetical protein
MELDIPPTKEDMSTAGTASWGVKPSINITGVTVNPYPIPRLRSITPEQKDKASNGKKRIKSIIKTHPS